MRDEDATVVYVEDRVIEGAVVPKALVKTGL